MLPGQGQVNNGRMVDGMGRLGLVGSLFWGSKTDQDSILQSSLTISINRNLMCDNRFVKSFDSNLPV